MITEADIKRIIQEIDREILVCIQCGTGLTRLLELNSAKIALLHILVDKLNEDKKAA